MSFSIADLHIAVVVILLNIASLMYSIGLNQFFPYPILLATLVALYLTPGANRLSIPIANGVGWYFLFAFSLIFSVIYNFDSDLFITAGGIYTSLIIINYFRSAYSLHFISLVLRIFVFFHFALLCISFFIGDFSVVGYSGIFRNPNTVGVMALAGFAPLISLLVLRQVGKSAYVLLLFFFSCIVISSSRTSFIIAVIIILWYLNVIRTTVSRKAFVSFVLVLIVFIFLLFPLINFSIVSKFAYYNETNDLLNGRDEIWAPALSGITLFGHGRAAAIMNNIGESVYIAVLYQFGVFAFIFWLLAVMFSVYNVMNPRFKFVEGIKQRILFPLIIPFVLQGVTGSVFGFSVFYIWIISLAWLSSDKHTLRSIASTGNEEFG